MPEYTVTAPDGKRYKVTAPEGASQDEVIARVKAAHPAPAATSQMPTKSTGSEANPIVRAVSAYGQFALDQAANTPASLGNLIKGLYQSVAHPVTTVGGLASAARGAVHNLGDAIDRRVPVLAQLDKLAAPVVDTVYGSPKTQAREKAQATAVGKFYGDRYGSPGAIVHTLRTDPAGAAADLSTVLSAGAGATARLAPRVSETLGEASGVVNPLNAAAALAEKALPVKTIRPTIEQIKAQKDAAYQASEAAGVNISGESMKTLGRDARQSVTGLHYDPAANLHVKRALSLVTGKAGKPMTLGELDAMRQNVRDIGYTRTGADAVPKREQAMIGNIVDTIDEHLTNLQPADVLAGDSEAGVSALKNARSLYQKGAKSETIDSAIENARSRSQQREGATSYGQALRQEFARIANNKNQMRRFSPDEQAAITEVANGTVTRRTLQFIARFAPRSPNWLAMEGTGAAGAALAGHPLISGMMLTPIGAGTAARETSNILTARSAAKARDVMLGAKSSPRQFPAGLKTVNKAAVPIARLYDVLNQQK